MFQTVMNMEIGPSSFRKNYLEAGEPLVISGLAKGWMALEKWTPAYLKQQYGELEVPIRDYQGTNGKPYLKRQMKLRDYLDYWERLDEKAAEKENLYLAEWNFAQQCPGLLDDFETPAHFQEDWIEKLPRNLQFGRLWIFIGHAGVHTPVHTDTFFTSAWLTMICGDKVVRLVSPCNCSAVRKGTDLFSPETELALNENGAKLYEAQIGAGDTLFIPGRWYHQVRNASKNIMLTKNFVDAANLLYFLAAFEDRLLEPIDALRKLREDYISEILRASGEQLTRGRERIRSVPTSSFIGEQEALTRDRVAQLERYSALLSRLSRCAE
jgi:hypothetical protein